MGRTHRTKRALVATGAAAIALTIAIAGEGILPARVALSQDKGSTGAQPSELAKQVEQSTQAYQDATATVESLSAQIADAEQHAEEVEQQLPAQRDRAAKSIKQLYVFQQSAPGLLELMVSANDFNEFITALEYMDAIHDHNTTQVTSLQAMYDDLEQTRAMLGAELDAAIQKQDEALHALDSIRSSYASIQQQAASSDEAKKNAATQALSDVQSMVSSLPPAVAEAIVQSAASQLDGATPRPTDAAQTDPNGEQIVLPPDVEPAERVVDSEVSAWAERIDAYLSRYGAPLTGQGLVFAQAALDYDVDPRLAPAIAVIESGGGKVCFRPHNAWGWGTNGWDDWPSAINGYVSGFSRGYGHDLSLEEAKAYASNDVYEMWYNLVLTEMASI